MPNIGPVELIILVVILLLVFGSRKLPELGRSLGSGMREFKDSVTGKDENEKKSLDTDTSSGTNTDDDD
jgi:sec-independent protein translocase protein TatA